MFFSLFLRKTIFKSDFLALSRDLSMPILSIKFLYFLIPAVSTKVYLSPFMLVAFSQSQLSSCQCQEFDYDYSSYDDDDVDLVGLGIIDVKSFGGGNSPNGCPTGQGKRCYVRSQQPPRRRIPPSRGSTRSNIPPPSSDDSSAVRFRLPLS